MMKNFLLVVDDDPSGFYVIEALLFKDGYNLQYAESGFEALEQLETALPDLILLDVMMPEMDGIEVCRQIKSYPQYRHIPIIMVTALDSTSDMVSCLEAGADDFVTKPVNGLELQARVRSLLRIKHQYDQLQESLKTQKATLKLRQDMAAMIVHDFRNPLTNIGINCELLKVSKSQEKQEKRIEQILASWEQLTALTDDLLMMAKMESGRLILNPELVDICQVIQRVVAGFEGLANRKIVELKTKCFQESFTLLIDQNLCRRVIENLVSNAIKFSPVSSDVTIEVDTISEPQKSARIRVRDRGIGIAPELQHCIFEKYEIGKPIQGVSQMGLGLAFCKMVVEAHQGKVFVEENKPQGSIFTVEFPLEVPAIVK
ncbi:MAG: response regulator [Cyanobacteriota bacterium]|nr:response regulator [Cyanobacteriota bacterium]